MARGTAATESLNCSKVLGPVFTAGSGVGFDAAVEVANGLEALENQLDEPPVGELVQPANAKAQQAAGKKNPERRRTGFLLR